MSAPELMLTEEVAELARRGIGRVLEAARRGQLASIQSDAGGPRRYWRKDVIDWINRGAPYKRPAGGLRRVANTA
jgi:hypothetical protein